MSAKIILTLLVVTTLSSATSEPTAYSKARDAGALTAHMTWAMRHCAGTVSMPEWLAKDKGLI